MSEKLGVQHETESVYMARRVLGRAALSLAGGALIALPFSLASSLDRAEVYDELGPIPSRISLAPGHTSLDLGPAGSLYSDSLTGHNIGLNVEVVEPPQLLESINSNNPNRLVQPFAAFYQDPSNAAEGYEEAMKRELRHEFITTELQTGAALSALAFLITSFSGNVAPGRRKQFIAATFGGLGLLSSLASYQTYDHWASENEMSADQYSITTLSGTGLGPVTASNPLLAKVINNATPFIKEQRERGIEENERFLASAHRSIDLQLSDEKFTPPEEGETLVLVLADIHSNQSMIETYQYLVDSINEKYGDDTLEITLLVGDQTYGSATEKGAIDGISRISDDIYGVNGNHDGPLTDEEQKARGIHLLEGETMEVTDDISVLGAADPSLTKLAALFGIAENVTREGDIESQQELGELLEDEAEETDPTFILSHEAYALRPLIDKEDITPDTMQSWFDEVSPVADLPANAILYGHWHREFKYKIVRDDAGRGAIVAELGTAGGASGKMSIGTLSFPWTTPAKQASAVLMTVDNSRELVTGIQEITTRTNGEVTFQPHEAIDQPPGLSDIIGLNTKADKKNLTDKKRRQ